MVTGEVEAPVATSTVTAWPHAGQNAVALEISLPHFEQYTESPYRANGQARGSCANPTSPGSSGQSPAGPVVSRLRPINRRHEMDSLQPRRARQSPRHSWLRQSAMNSRRRSNHSMLKKMLLLTLQQAPYFAKTHCVHWQDLGRGGEPLHPRCHLQSLIRF